MPKSLISLIILTLACTEQENPNEQFIEPNASYLGVVAQQIFDQTLTEEEFISMDLSDDEILVLMLEVGVLAGGDSEELAEWIYGDHQNKDPLYRGSCVQNLEKADLSDDTYVVSYYQDTWCDGDGSDVDWVFEFAPTWADDPDNMRWWATNWWVRQTFSAPSPLYNGLLLGSSLCTSPVRVCLGTNGVSAAGGAATVANSLFISH